MQEKQYSFTDVKQSEEMDTSGPECERVKCFKLAIDKFKHIVVSDVPYGKRLHTF